MRIFRRRTFEDEVRSIRRAGDIRVALEQMLVPKDATNKRVTGSYNDGRVTFVFSFTVIKDGMWVQETVFETSGTSAADVRRIQARLRTFNEKK